MKLRNLQALRAVAALGVIFFHLNIPGSALGEAGVDLFFIISGFIMIFITPESLDSLKAYARFMGHRITRIYPPFWFVLFPLILLWITAPGLFDRLQSMPNHHVDILRSILLLPQNSLPLLAVSWTLIHEIYFYVVVGFALILDTRGRWIFGSVWFLLAWLGYALFNGIDFTHLRSLQIIISPFSLTFLLGYFIGLLHPFLIQLPSGFRLMLVLLGVVLLIGFHPAPWKDSYPNNNHLARFFGYGLPLSFIVAGFVTLEGRFSLSHPFVQLLGDASYSLYLVHQPFIAAFYGALNAFHLHRYLPSTVATILCLSCCLFAGVIFHWYAERPLIRFSRKKVEKLFGA